MPFKTDVTQMFRELGHDLIPSDESILGVIRALPKGEAFRRGETTRIAWTRAIPITYEGEAAAWPHLFAGHESRPGHFTTKDDWFFWIVITDKQLHVLEGRTVGRGKPRRPGPETAHFPLDRIDEIRFDRQWGISELSIWFEDGSSVRLDVGLQDTRPFLAAIRPFERAGSQRPRSTGFMPPIARWSLAIAVLVLGMALAAGASDGARAARVLDYRGEVATATVTLTDVGPEASRLAIEFSDDIGFSSATEVASCDAVEDVRAGDRFAVVYDPDDLSIAHPQGCSLSTQGTLGLLVPGVALIVVGTFLVLRSWSGSGWRRRWIGIPFALFGLLIGATALTERDCFCLELVYFGAALVVIGVAAQVAPRRGAAAAP